MTAPRLSKHHLALLALLALALALRVYRLDRQSLWYDEAVTAQVVQQGLGDLARWTADDIQPPLYYLVVAGWTAVAGTSEWALRFPSVWFGVLMVALAYALGRRLFGRRAGLLAALLAAVHPLWVYYSQEARMYTMLTALGILAGALLLAVLAAGMAEPYDLRRRLAPWAGLVLAAIALLYTHYFGAFLLLAFALYFLGALLTVRGYAARRLLAEGAVAAAVAVVAYLPWLPNALRRLRVDSSYWQGSLKLDEALRHVAISFTSGETMLEARAIPLAVALALLAGLCLLSLGWWAAADRAEDNETRTRRWRALLFVVLYLAVPVTAILLLSYRTPKFNPRYLMLASPGLILLLAGGLAVPLDLAREPGRRAAQVGRAVAWLALGAVLVVYLAADRNWFTDPAFTKDDWRGAVAFVRDHLAPDEGVVLVSGHAWPAWHYYAPDVDPVRLPATEILDVNAVLDLGAAQALNAGLQGKQGAWLVRWQDEVVDPNGVVPYLLGSAGTLEPGQASFWGLGAPQHYRWSGEPDFSSRPDITYPTAVNFGDQVELLGYSQPPCSPETGPACDLLLFWRALAPLSADYKLTATLEDGEGHAWSPPQDRRLAAYTYPTFRWQPGTAVLSRVQVTPDLGTPPGPYRLRLGVYDGDSGQPLDVVGAGGAPRGQWAWLDPVVVYRLAVEGPGTAPDPSGAVETAPGIQLLQAGLEPIEAVAGQPLLLESWWQAGQSPESDYALGWQWIDPAGEPAQATIAPAAAQPFPTRGWPVGAPVRSQVDVKVLPAALEVPGRWHLRIGLSDPDDPSRFAGETLDLPVEVQPGQHDFAAPPLALPVGANLGNQVELLGLASEVGRVDPGDPLRLTLVWQALAGMDAAYTGFLHLVSADGQVVAQDDHLAGGVGHPTSNWLSGEVVSDTYRMALPAALPPGTYSLEAGLYDAGDPGLRRLGEAVYLGEVDIAPP